MLRKFSEHLKQLRESNNDGCLGVVSGQAIMGGSNHSGLDLPDMETNYNDFLEALRQRLDEKKKMSGKLVDAETGDGEVVEPTSSKDVPVKDKEVSADAESEDDSELEDGDEIALMKKKMKDVKKKMAEAIERIEEGKKCKKMDSGCPKCGEEGCKCKEKKRDFLKLAGIDSKDDDDDDSSDQSSDSSSETPEMMKKKMKESAEDDIQSVLDMMNSGRRTSDNWDGLPQ